MLNVHDALRPDVLHRGRAAALRVRRRAGHDHLRPAPRRGVGRHGADAAPLDRSRRARDLEDARHLDATRRCSPRCRAAWASSASRSTRSRGSTSAATRTRRSCSTRSARRCRRCPGATVRTPAASRGTCSRRCPNVEDNELFYPLLYLWRRELPDSGGAGKFRGGNGCEGAIVPHKTESIALGTITGEVAVPGPGLFGGYPTSTNSYVQVKGAKVQRARRRGRPHALVARRARGRARLRARQVVRPGADPQRRLGLRVVGRRRLRRSGRARSGEGPGGRGGRARVTPTGRRVPTAS